MLHTSLFMNADEVHVMNLAKTAKRHQAVLHTILAGNQAGYTNK